MSVIWSEAEDRAFRRLLAPLRLRRDLLGGDKVAPLPDRSDLTPERADSSDTV
jgi:hypothetical protein